MKVLVFLCSALLISSSLCAQTDRPDGQTAAAKPSGEPVVAPVKIELAEGSVILIAPKEWKQVKPRFPQMVQYEFNAPADAKEGEAPVRITVMASGGGLQGNLERWYSQFTQPDNRPTKEVALVEEVDVAGPKVHFVKITGTYSGGMMPGGRAAAPKENHQLISGIIETKKQGTFFITAIGPIEECEKLEEGFNKMLEEIKSK